jgi:hypothetical protein
MKLLKNATIMPLEGSMDSFTGGIYTADGQFVEESLLYRGRPAALQKSVEHLSETYIYGGCLFRHFGHLIWESLSRLYMIRQCKDYPILFINPQDEQLNDRLCRFFKIIGVKNEIRLVKVPTSVEELIYCPPGSSINPLYISDEQINSLQCFNFSKNIPDNNSEKKIWISRSNLLFGVVVNELIIEKVLAKIGYKIIQPELLTLQEQVRLMCKADIVAGFDGSAFFSLLFSKDIYSKFYIFNRRQHIPRTLPYVFEKRNVQFALHNFDLEYIAGEGACAYYNHPAPEKIIDVLKEL